MVVNMMWRMRQQTPAVVGSVERQVVGAKEIIASGIDQVVAVAVYRQSLPVESVLGYSGFPVKKYSPQRHRVHRVRRIS